MEVGDWVEGSPQWWWKYVIPGILEASGVARGMGWVTRA
jgi:hypothetical protein